MVCEGFSKSNVFENDFQNRVVQPPKLDKKTVEIWKKTLLKTQRFSTSFVHRFWTDLGAQNHPKMRSGTCPTLPRALPERLLNAPMSQKGFPDQIFDGLGSIWDRFWKDLGTKIRSKVLPKHTKSVSGLLILSPPRPPRVYPHPPELLRSQPPSLQSPVSTRPQQAFAL